MRRRLICVLGVVIALSLAATGCSRTDEATGSRSPAEETTVPTTDPVLATESAEVRSADLLEAVDRLTLTSFRFEVSAGHRAEAEESADGGPPFTVGEYDGRWASATTSANIDGENTRVLMESVTDDVVGYLFTPSFPAPPDNPLSLASEQWVAVDIEKVEDEIGLEFSVGVTAFEVFQSLRTLLSSADDMMEGAASTSRGVPTRTFTFSFTDPDVPDSAVFGSPESSVVLQIDADGWIRQLDTSSEFFEQRVEFYDIGSSLAVEQPADAVDITGEFLEPTLGVPEADGDLSKPPHARLRAFELLERQPELSDFAELVAASGIQESLLDSEQTWTLITPTNHGLRDVGPALTQVQDSELVTSFVAAHLVVGAPTEASLVAAGEARTTSDRLAVRQENGRTVIGPDALVLVFDVDPDEGGIIIVDRPLPLGS